MTLAAVLNFTAPHGPAWLFLGVGLAIVVGPLLATRVGLPGIIGLLAGGLVIGPHGFGIVSATDPTVPALGQLGLLYLMFSAGAELDLGLFHRYRNAAVGFGLMTFAAPMALGFTAGRLLDYSLPASLLLGSLWASHTLVTYPMVRQAGLSGNRAVATAVGATVMTDTLSLVVLAGVAGSVKGNSGLAGIIVSLVLGLAALASYAIWVLPRIARWFFAGPGHEAPVRFAFLVAAMLSAAVLAEVVGIEGIVGAFFAGLGLNRRIPAGSALMERLEFFGTALLVPLFLISVGILIEPSVMIQPSTLGLAAVFCAAVMGGKAIAAFLARPVFRFTWGESELMFGLTLSQAAATLAATLVGFDIGLFGEQVVNAVLVVILVTLLVAAVVTARSLPKVEPTPSDTVELGRRPIVVDAREDRLGALSQLARALVEPDGGMVVAVRVTTRAADAEVDRSFLGLVVGALDKAGLETRSRVRLDPNPVDAVAALAVEESATVVVLDWLAATRHQPALKGGRDDSLLGVSLVPVVFAALSDVAVGRVVLALDQCDLDPASEADLATAVDVAGRVAAGCDRLVLGAPGAGADAAPADPEPDADRMRQAGADGGGNADEGGPTGTGAEGDVAGGVEPGGLVALLAGFDGSPGSKGMDRDTWVAQAAEPGDLVVLPAHPDWWRFGPVAVRASTRTGVSVLVVAHPDRWAVRSGAFDQTFGTLVGRTTPTAPSWG